jgi:hypothetical protein
MSHFIHPQFTTIDGLSIRYASTARVGQQQDALLLSPWPER